MKLSPLNIWDFAQGLKVFPKTWNFHSRYEILVKVWEFFSRHESFMMKHSLKIRKTDLPRHHLYSLLPSFSFQPNLTKFQENVGVSLLQMKKDWLWENKQNFTSSSCSSDPSSFNVALLKIIFDTWFRHKSIHIRHTSICFMSSDQNCTQNYQLNFFFCANQNLVDVLISEYCIFIPWDQSRCNGLPRWPGAKYLLLAIMEWSCERRCERFLEKLSPCCYLLWPQEWSCERWPNSDFQRNCLHQTFGQSKCQTVISSSLNQ